MRATAAAVILTFAGTAFAACQRVGSTQLTFYGFPDNDPPSDQTAYNCGGRNNHAGGSGTYSDPVTMASAAGEFSQCEIVYVPYLKKYVRYEDFCAQCTSDYKSGKKHIDIWTGANTNGGQDQINCENNLTPNGNGEVVIIRSPAQDYEVDSTALYKKGASSSCRKNHVFPDNKAHNYCK